MEKFRILATAQRPNQKHSFLILIVTMCMFFTACTSSKTEREIEAARKQIQNQNIVDGLILYDRLLKVHPNSKFAIRGAVEASAVCLKEKACGDREEGFLKFIIQKSNKEPEQIQAQKRLCEMYYDKGFYPQAMLEMDRLLSKQDFKDGRLAMRLKLARANFYIKHFYQAQAELKNYLKDASTDEEKFEGYLLQADIQSADKKYIEAMQTYKFIQDHFKKLYMDNQVYMNEVLLMEEQKQLDQAIGILEDIKHELSNADVVQVKIDRLKERRALMPGASGLKR